MSSGLSRLRIVIVVAMAAIVAIAAGEVFDRIVWWLLAAPALTGTAAVVAIDRRWTIRFLLASAATAVSVGVVVAASGGTAGDTGAAFGAGFQRVLSTDWPSPDRPDLVGTIAFGLALMTASAAELARRNRLHLSPLAPIVLGHVAVIALSAPSGVRLRWVLPLAVLSICLATLRPRVDVALRDRLTLLRGERRLVPMSLIAIAIAAAFVGPVALTDRADPRRNDPPASTAALLDPIEATLALQAIDPPIDLHEIRVDGGETAVSGVGLARWRTAALVEYDGRQWSPDLALRPIGRRLGAPDDASISVSITFLDDDLQLVPLPGAAITIDASVETDRGRSIVRLAGRPSSEDVIELTSRVERSLAESNPSEIGARAVDESSVGLTELAAALVENGGASPNDDLLTQLRAIESVMREEFILRKDASGGGLQRALIERFLRDTQRGNSEQFSTAFVLLARSLGVDARVATGFEVDPERIDRSGAVARLTLSSVDARIWPEVHIGDGWVAFDPVPEVEDTDTVPPEPEPQVQSPAAPQPPIVPPPESADEPVVTEDDADTDADRELPAVVAYALAIGAGLAALLVPIALVIAIILGLKWRKRRRRLAGSPPERIRGAWAVATDRLVDAGMTIDGSETNDEIASDAVTRVPTAHRELHRLATLSSATTFGNPVRPDLLAQDAIVCLGQVETSMSEDRTGWERLRWRLSLRSLRSKTASPV